MIANALPRPITAGSVDNAILRADGTNGSALQNSGLVVEDTIISFASITGVASTDIITATGSAFANGQPIRFTSLTGGTGLNTTTNYYVINVSGATFQVSTSLGGGASLFTTNITAGTLLTGHSVSTNVTLSENTTETNSALVLTPKGTGALIAGPKPDGTTTGGNARGSRAVDLQLERTAATQVAVGANSFAVGASNTVSNQYSMAIGNNNSVTGASGSGAFGTSNTSSAGSFPSFAFGTGNTASGTSSIAMGRSCTAGSYSISAGGFSSASGDGCAAFGNTALASGTNSQVFGQSCTANTTYTQASGEYALANRYGMFARASGAFSGTATGDAQRAQFVMRNKTTTNAAVELFLDGSATRLTIPSGKYLTGTINIAGIKSDGTAAASYIRQFSIKNVAATTSLVGTVNLVGIDTASLTSISITANDTNDALKVEVTGILSETWRWVAAVDVVEVAYGA